jgi:beta-carotene 3-hydroxylase
VSPATLERLAAVSLFCATFVAMEGVAALTHRYVMHGWLWCWHRSHHEPRSGRFERNDLFAVAFALPSIALIHAGVGGRPELLAIGLGMAAYGLAYVVFHDGIVHRRVPMPRFGGRYVRRIVQAHRLHHTVRTRDGAVSYGFLYAAEPRDLRRTLLARRTH